MKHAVFAIALLTVTAGFCAAQKRPEAFGVILGTDQSATVRAANYEAMKACIEAALAANAQIILPANTIEMDVPNRGSAAGSTFRINRNLTMIGSDRRLSRLKFGPEAPTYDYSGFSLGPGVNVSFKDLVIEGPSNPGGQGKFDRLTYAILQSGMSYGPGGTKIYNTPGELRLENVSVAGEWYTSIQGSHGDTALIIINSDITGYTQCVAWTANYNSGKSLYARNTYFHDAGLPGKGHLLYLSPNVSFEIDGCRFGGNFRNAIHHYGSASGAPKYARLLNSKFESTCAEGIATTNTGHTEITNCTFDNRRRAVILKGDTTIKDCTFNNGSSVNTYDIHSGVTIKITHSKFNGGGVITSVWRDCNWTISDCDFVGTSQYSIGIANGAPGTNIRVTNCRFSGTLKRGIVAAGGTYEVTNCNFQGTYGEAAIVYDDTSGDVQHLSVDGCTFDTASRSIWARVGGSGKISGGSNSFGKSQPLAQAGMYQSLDLRQAVSPGELRSAPLLVASFDFDRYRITGSSRIDKIQLGSSDATTQMCGGKLKLVVAGSWSLGEGANIKPLTTAARRPGDVVTLVRDGSAGLWVEVTN